MQSANLLVKKGVCVCIALHPSELRLRELRGVTYHMGSHSFYLPPDTCERAPS